MKAKVRPIGMRSFIFETLFLVATVTLFFAGQAMESMRTLSLIFASIVLEAVPFMLLGAVVGGLLETFVSRERIASLLPRKRWKTVLIAAGLGVIFPVCECAIVPIVRRLSRKGLPMAGAVAYLLGGPIANPIVAGSTLVAYKLEWPMMAARFIGGYLIAVAIGLAMDRIFRKRQAFVDDVAMPGAGAAGCACGHDHDHQDGHDGESGHEQDHEHEGGQTCACGHHHAAPKGPRFIDKMRAAMLHAADDFLGVGHYLVIGAFIAAVAQTYIDRTVFTQIFQIPVLSILMMMALAILLNLCSEADAFIAASFRGIMPMSAQLAFLLTGPMFDLKLLLMYQGLFRKRAIAALASLILVSAALVSIAAHYSGFFTKVMP